MSRENRGSFSFLINFLNFLDQDYNNYDEDEEYQQYAQMGTGIGFAPKKNTPKYADSYFYNSPDMKYPTINDQKKLARSIAATLEGSNTASKYHKKKETINRQLAADDEEYNTQNSGYYQPQNDYYTQHQHQQQQFSYHHKGHGVSRKNFHLAKLIQLKYC